MYTISKIKTFIGRDGYGLNATICRAGKPICFVLDEGCGGEVRFDFRNYKQALTRDEAAQAEARLGEYCLSLLAVDERGTARSAIETWVNTTVDAHQNDKRFNRIAKTKTLFRLKADPASDWRTMPGPCSPAIQAYLAKTYPNQIDKIWGVQL